MTRDHQKHAESTYLDEYLRFKKNLVEKFPLDIFLEQFVRAKPKMRVFFTFGRFVGPTSISHSFTQKMGEPKKQEQNGNHWDSENELYYLGFPV